MGTRFRVASTRWIVFFAASAAFAVATGCGDDESSGDPGKGGSSNGGSGGDAGEPNTGGTSGSGGSAGSSGRGGTSGTDGGMGGEPAGGTGGAAGGDTGGTGGTDGGMGGDGGVGGDPIQYWPEGFTANGISSTVDDRFHGVAIQGQNVYATGYLGNGVVTSGTTRQVVVAKFDSQARLVTGFGNQGLATVDLSNYAGLPDDPATTTDNDPDPSQETGRDIALQSDGKIIVAGVVERASVTAPDRTTPVDIFVMRFDATGMHDNTFNTAGGGIQYLSPGTVPSTNPLAYGVEVDSMNRIYVFAHGNATHATRTDQDRYVYRLNADGTLDMGFGTNGFFTFDTPGATATAPISDNVRRGAILANGNVIVSGYASIGGRNTIVLGRATTGGMPDMTFSGDGFAKLSFRAQGMAECYGVAVQSDGSLITTGYGSTNADATGSERLDMISFRVRPDGSDDTTWAGAPGGFNYDVNSLEDRGRDVLALPDDRVLFAGAGTLTTGDKDSMLLLLDKDGMPTEDFTMDGTSRRLFGSFGSPGDEFFAVAQTPGTTGARIVAAAGYAPSGASLANGNGTLAVIPVPAP